MYSVKDREDGMRPGKPPKIKICGLTRREDIQAVNEACPEYVGFVFAKSRRQVSMEQAAFLRGQLRREIIPVGVFVDEQPDHILQLLEQGIIEMAQLHGRESQEELGYLKKRTEKGLIKAIRPDAQNQPEAWQQWEADFLLFDGGSGDGKPFDWKKAEWAKQCGKPFFLAGGLCRENVEKGMELFEPYALDVSSGVERDGKKDPEKIREFVRTVRKGKRE